MNNRTTLLATAFALLGTSASTLAQDAAVDVGLYEGENGNLEVRVISHGDFDGIFSSLVFTLRWDRTSGAELGQPLQPDAIASYMPIRPSGDVQEEGGSNYQVFAGFGMETIRTGSTAWVAGKEYLIAEIPVVGHTKVELVNDGWTQDIHHNGDYFVSLGGLDRTGAITKSLAVGGLPGFDFSVLPNPNNGLFALTVSMPEEKDLWISLASSSGRIVVEQQLKNTSGTFRKDFDLSGMSNGVYYLRLVMDGKTIIKKVVFQ